MYSVVDQIIFDLLHQEVMKEILEKHIVNYFDTSDAAGKIGEKLLSIAVFIQC